MDQSSTTQAYVSGMKEALQLNGNELVEFTTYFSIGYALAIVPSQVIQMKWRPSLFLPICEIIWGTLTLVYVVLETGHLPPDIILIHAFI
jgi:ACS family pantothenate transporter-like MFS transporter